MKQWLKNVLLEVGEQQLQDCRIKTETSLFHLLIDENGRIEKMVDFMEDVEDGIDFQGQLAIPPFKDYHNHLDKTYLSLGWKACQLADHLVGRLEIEAQEQHELAGTIEQRATAMIELLLSYGIRHIRTHVNIDPIVQLENLKGVKRALEAFDEYLTYEIVAFPQQGILKYPEMPKLLDEALKNGATILGALDPAGIDGNIEKSLQMTMDLAQSNEVDVDFHLHDRAQVGIYTMERWLEMVQQQQYLGKTDFSHAFSLSEATESKQRKLAKQFAQNNININSTIPISIHSTIIPIDLLIKEGVKVRLGSDGFYDSWSPYVSGDPLEKLNHFCDYTGKSSERALRQSLSLITGGITALDERGNHQWPKVGDKAELLFVHASCSAEVVARIPDNRQLFIKNSIVLNER